MRRLLATAALVYLFLAPCSAAADEAEFFFFSPEVGSGNLSLLTKTAEAYFREADLDLKFQAFVRLEDLSAQFDERRPAFLLAPEWALAGRCFARELRPLARPIRDGRLFDRRALLAGRSVGDVDRLDGGSIATTVPAADAARRSNGLARFRRDHPGVRIIPVPKDVDALLAVGFGQVDAAFVSIAQLEMLARVNPSLTGSLHEVGYSDQSPFPLVYATGHADEELATKLADALATADRSARGSRLAGLLGFDQWSTLAPGDVDVVSAGACAAGSEATR